MWSIHFHEKINLTVTWLQGPSRFPLQPFQSISKFTEICLVISQHIFYIFSDHTRLGHWILDGDAEHSNLLRFSLTEENFTDTTVLLCVAMTTPWNIMDQLRNWATILQDHIDKLTLTAEKTKKLQNESKHVFFYIISVIISQTFSLDSDKHKQAVK